MRLRQCGRKAEKQKRRRPTSSSFIELPLPPQLIIVMPEMLTMPEGDIINALVEFPSAHVSLKSQPQSRTVRDGLDEDP